MNSVIDFLSSGMFATAIAVLSAVVTYLYTRKRTRLAFLQKGERLLGLSDDGLPQGITVQFQGLEITRLTRTLVVIWNDGENIIRKSDVVNTEPLRFELAEDEKVLTANILKSARTVNQITAATDPKKENVALIDFDFLDENDGAVIEILHSAENRFVEVSGVVRGLPKGLSDLGKLSPGSDTLLGKPIVTTSRRMAWAFALIGTSLMFFALLVPAFKPDWLIVEGEIKTTLILSGAALYFFLGATLFYLSRRRYPKKLHLVELEPGR